jgi:uncharacterized protein YbjT (DUF2867 family)
MNLLITGASGMVGEGVLHTALNNKAVSSVIVIGRKTCQYTHPKLKELIVSDFSDISIHLPLLKDIDACLFCAGVSSVGKNETLFTALTYDVTISFAKQLFSVNPQCTFSYISGVGTDSSEKGKIMWARVKGKTENDLLKIGFKAVYNFRPSYLKPIPGMRFTQPYYKYIDWLYPVFNTLAPHYFSTLEALALAMIQATILEEPSGAKEVKDIKRLSSI